MTFFGVVIRCGALLTALVAVFIGCLVANVPGQLGLWSYLDAKPMMKGTVPFLHEGTPWGFNHSTLSADALKGRTILVTGANTGLGLGTVQYLAQHGAHVILACRSQKNCDEAVSIVKAETPSASLTSLVLDLSSFKSIKKFAEEVIRTTPKLHSLILNAGIAHVAYGLTEDGLEQHMGVNHFGHAYLVRLLEPLLKQSASKELPGTIVLVSSNAHYNSYPEGVRLSVSALNEAEGYDRARAYAQSKLANVLYAQSLAERLRSSGILVNSLNPGLVETNALTNVLESRLAIAQAAYPGVTNLFLKFSAVAKLRAFFTSLIWDPKDAALTQVYLAVSPEVLNKRVHGKYFSPIARETAPSEIHATNATLQKGLWDLTEEVLAAKALK